MNPFIQVFEVREPFGALYVLPPLDVLSDAGDCALPATPQLTSVYPGSVGWFVVPGAVSYKVERNLGGTGYSEIGTVEQPTDPETTELVFHSTSVQHFAYYRVIAVNACGDSAPSAPMDLHIEAQQGSGDSSCTLWIDPCVSLPPTGLIVSDITTDGFTLTLDAAQAPVAGFTFAIAFEPTYNDFPTEWFSVDFPANTTSIVVTGLPDYGFAFGGDGRTYYPRISTYVGDYECESEWVNLDPVVLLPLT